jgi:periplasmic protein TonB
MSSATFSPFVDRRDSLSGTLLFSIFLHAALFFTALAYTKFGLNSRHGWGNWDTSGAIHATAVTSLPGVPLPTPVLATMNNVANQNPGLYKVEPVPLSPPQLHAEELPKFKEEVKPEKVVRVNKRMPKVEVPPPMNAIPAGEGGKPVMTTGQFANSAGEGELNVATGDFGQRYGWYVSAVRTRISTNWLLSTISPSILTAPRVYLTFDILRDGSIENVQITQSSGIPEVDRSALRAVLASNPLGPLPPDFSGSKVSVNFFFDFHRH